MDTETAVIITVEECEAFQDFCRFFEVPVSAALRGAIESFKLAQTPANQLELKYHMAKLVTSDHEIFKDPEVMEQAASAREYLDSISRKD